MDEWSLAKEMKQKHFIWKTERGNFNSRVIFYRKEILSSLPKEMLAAQNEIPNNAHCNGEFYVDYAVYPAILTCKMPGTNGNGYKLYMWSPTNNNWMEQKR